MNFQNVCVIYLYDKYDGKIEWSLEKYYLKKPFLSHLVVDDLIDIISGLLYVKFIVLDKFTKLKGCQFTFTLNSQTLMDAKLKGFTVLCFRKILMIYL